MVPPNVPGRLPPSGLWGFPAPGHGNVCRFRRSRPGISFRCEAPRCIHKRISLRAVSSSGCFLSRGKHRHLPSPACFCHFVIALVTRGFVCSVKALWESKFTKYIDIFTSSSVRFFAIFNPITLLLDARSCLGKEGSPPAAPIARPGAFRYLYPYFF